MSDDNIVFNKTVVGRYLFPKELRGQPMFAVKTHARLAKRFRFDPPRKPEPRRHVRVLATTRPTNPLTGLLSTATSRVLTVVLDAGDRRARNKRKAERRRLRHG
jgi:hypothetical protein